MSATLNAGQAGSLTKSVTAPRRTRSRMLPERAAEQHPGRQPHERAAEMRREVGQQRHQGDADDRRDHGAAAGERPERHAVVAHVHELDAGQHAVLGAHGDVRAHERLGSLVEGHDDRRHDRRAEPGREGRAHPAIRFWTTRPTNVSTTIATTGLRSSGPIAGMKRRKIAR